MKDNIDWNENQELELEKERGELDYTYTSSTFSEPQQLREDPITIGSTMLCCCCCYVIEVKNKFKEHV